MSGWRYPRVIAHRCGGALAPENTLAGLHIAARLGVQAVEFDAMLSSDGIPVLIHDETLERTTNGHGHVAQTAAAVLAGLDAGVQHHRAFVGEPLPTLAAALSLCDQLGLAVNLEIKPASGHELDTGRTVAALAAKCAPRAGLLLSSFSEPALLAARAAAPGLPRAVLVESLPDGWADLLARHESNRLHVAAVGLSSAAVAPLFGRQIEIAAYTVNRPTRASELFALGVTAIFSDRPDLLL